jgi:hypothetical protein
MPEPQDFEIVAQYKDDPEQTVVFRGKDPRLVAEAMRKHAAETKRQLTFDGSNYTPEVLSLFKAPGAPTQLPSPDPTTAPGVPEGQWNAMKRDALQAGGGVLSGLLSGTGLRGAAVSGALGLGLGRGMDNFFSESRERPIRQGEVAGEVLGSTVSPLARFIPALKNANVTREMIGGGAAGLGSTMGTNVPAEEGAAGGALAGGLFGLLGDRFQRRLRASGGATNELVDKTLETTFGTKPLKEDADLHVNRDELRAIGDMFLQERGKKGSIAGAVEYLSKKPTYQDLIRNEVNEQTKARTQPIMQASNTRRGKEVALGSERSQEAVRRVLETKELGEIEKKIALARTSGERAPLELEREAKLLGLAARRANLHPDLKKAMSEFKTAEAYERKVKALQARAKTPLEAQKVANDVADSFYKDLTTETGFNPRKIEGNPEAKAALEWVATTKPEVMMKNLFSKPEESTAVALGLKTIFGANSKEMASVRRAAITHMFDKAITNEGVGAGKIYDAAKLGTMLDGIEPLALNTLFGKENSHQILRGLENVISQNAQDRAKKPLHGMLSGGLGAGSAVFLLMRETDPTRAAATLAGLATVKIVADNIPDMIEKIMLENSPRAAALRRYLANPTPGNAGVLQAAHFFSNLGQDTTKKSTEAPQ